MTNHQSKPSNITMHPLIIVTLLFGSSVLCKPNQQHQRTDYDKQPFRKALDETNLPTSRTSSSSSSLSSSSSSSSSSLSSSTQSSAALELANASAAAANFQCPEQFGYYTDARDCTKYYVCVFGEVLHESCTGGLRFSRELQTCDWPRNVDCPQASAANQNNAASSEQQAIANQASSSPASTSTSASPTTASSGSSPFPTTTSATSTSTSSGGLLKHQANNKEASNSNGNNNNLAANLESEERSLKGASLVFADEGSDPQQPSFDEAISPVITADGAIHLHDGSGGTYSLTNAHNARATNQMQGQPLQQQPASQNVDVFVKPLVSQQQQQQQLQKNQRARINQQQQQQQQQQSTSNINGNRQVAATSSKILPAILPEQRARTSNNQHHQSQSSNNMQQLPQTTTMHSIGANNQHFAQANNKNSNDELSLSEISGESEQPNDSISAQADQESNENQDSANDSESANLSDNNEPNNNANSRQAGAYIPPVMAPNPLRQVSASSSNRQSSQLISVNSRQVEARQTFKPVLVSSSSLNNQQPQQLTTNEFVGAAAANQRNQAPFQGFNLNSNNNDDDQQDQLAELRAGNNNNNLRQPQARGQNHTNGLLHHSAQAMNMNLVAQNNRPSRMSAAANFQQQFNPPQANPLASSERNRFLPLDQSHPGVNFNESSKLIRLQASQFESSSTPSQPHHMQQQQQQHFHNQHAHHSSSNNNNNNNNNQQQLDANSNAFSQKFPPQSASPGSRSQSVLFSQQPFGFVADSNNNNNHNFPDRTESGAPQAQLIGASLDAQNAREASLTSNLGDGSANFPPPGSAVPLLQQQRRQRPPKRQQIPTGSQRQRPNQQLRPTIAANQLIEQPPNRNVEQTPTTTNQPLITTSAGGFLLANELAAFSDQEEPPTPAGLAPAGNLRSQLSAGGRPIVAPATVNFQQQADFGATTPATLTTTTSLGGSRRLTAIGGDNLAPLTSNNLRNLQGQRAGQQQQQQQQSLGLLANIEQPPLSSLIATNANANLRDQLNGASQSASNANQQLTSTTNNGAIASSTTASNAMAATTSANQEQDPQLVANRYLNSAIDALEAGQPFGTNDYDFDILNDNSTDRRNPTTSAANQTTLAASFNSNQPNANRQRHQQSAASNFNQHDEGENIGLTNGQLIGASQLGLLNAQQQPTGRLRTGSSQGTGGRLQQSLGQQQQQFANQQEPFVSNLAPQTSAAVASAASSSSNSGLGSTGQTPTKKPRPTNKKISVNHEQALANNRASTEPARRPESLFATPTALQTASKCDNRVCRLPDCKCGDTLTPLGMDPKVIPQVVLLTFDDAVNDLNWEIYEELFTGRTNPNGCPILATFYVSHEWTDYGQVQTLYSRGHEMASHSVTHSFGEKFSKSQWFKEVNGQREILNMYGGVKMNDVRGMRAPFLQIGGNKMFEMLYDANFTYDSSMPIFENSPPLWPYTLDYQVSHECMITPCPTKSFPGVWEVGMTMWVDLRGGRCSMGDACSNPPDEDGVYEMLMKNFNRHYKSNRAPFGLFYHSAWFNTVHHRRGFLRFMGTVNSLSDVFFVTNWQMLQWMRKPTPVSEINSFEPWQCPAKNDRPPPCFHPSVCNVKSEHGTRFMKTCQPCPANQQYPWVGSTGFKGKQAGGSG